MKQGALGSELDVNPAERRAIWSREDSRFLDFFMASTPFLHRLEYSMLILKCTLVLM